MDIVSGNLSEYDDHWEAKIKVNGTIPGQISQRYFLEWDIMVDTDLNINTGWDWPLYYNNIGVDYNFRLVVTGTKQYAEVWRASDDAAEDIDYSVDNDTITLRFDKIPSDPTSIYFVVLARKYADGDTPLSFDKTPASGHYTFPGNN